MKIAVPNSIDFFIERVRTNLHLCLAFSPIGDHLRIRMRLFPSLVNCTTIDWLNPWPDDALLSVAKIFLEDIEIENSNDKLVESL